MPQSLGQVRRRGDQLIAANFHFARQGICGLWENSLYVQTIDGAEFFSLA